MKNVNFEWFSGDNCRQRKRPSDLMKCHTQVPCNKESAMEKGNQNYLSKKNVIYIIFCGETDV